MMRVKAKILACALLACTTLSAAEVQLRDQANPSGPLVLLGDVATIHARHAVEAAELATIDLMAAPPAGETRELRLRELQDLLVVRGINLAELRFSGAATVRVRTPKAETPLTIAPPVAAKPLAVSAPQRISKREVTERVQVAIESHLNAVEGEQAVDFEFKLTNEQVAELNELGDSLRVASDKVVDAATHSFVLAGKEAKGKRVNVLVTMHEAPMLVVAKHTLAKGMFVHAEDVRLQRGRATQGRAEVFQSIEDVVGKETTRVIAEGTILDDRSVRRPLLVRRGEMVTVYSRAEGVSVRTTARVREDGAAGDLVSVETVEQRKPFFARVSGPQQVEVFAQVATAASEQTQAATERDPYSQSKFIATPHGANAAQYRTTSRER
jgi:flagella basal body P-ring formation protein FlgA